MVGWSLGRSSGEKVADAAKQHNAATTNTTNPTTRRPFRSTSAANRARPSSMISLSFPSSEVVDHAFEGDVKVREDNMTAAAAPAQNDRSPVTAYNSNASAAVHMLAVAQQRDMAQRQRTTSTGSSSQSSIHNEHTDHTAAGSVKSRIRKGSASPTASSSLPSLMKSPITRSPVAALSTSSMLASPSPSSTNTQRATAKSSSHPKPAASKSSQLSTGPDGDDKQAQNFFRPGVLSEQQVSKPNQPKALSNITNVSKKDVKTASNDARLSYQQQKGKASSLESQSIGFGNAVDSLLRLQAQEAASVPVGATSYDDGSAELPDVGLGDITGANDSSLTTKSLEAQENAVIDHAYETRKPSVRRTGRLRNPKQKMLPATTFASPATHAREPVRYEVNLTITRSLAPLSFSEPQSVRYCRVGLIGTSLPSRFGCDRAAYWAVERGARIAACIVNLLGS